MTSFIYTAEVGKQPCKPVSVKRLSEGGEVHRYVLWPDADISNEDTKVQAICDAAWTEDILALWQKELDQKEAALILVNAPTIEKLKAERQRRIYQIADPDKQAYYSRLMISWLELGKETWTSDQITQVEAVRAGNTAIDAIVAKASLLEAMDPIPADYQNDKWWTNE
ncbi:hypothetical protein [Maritalea sp.]|uniref:hypothetical protein n=1 Tax=Maritalea sp. TaxID=2003361 RepID=UPI003EF62C82